MGIFFNEDWDLTFPVSINEFETDGKKYTDDEEDEYKVDEDTEEDQDDETPQEDNPDDGGEEEPAPEDGEGTEDGTDEYTLDTENTDDGEGDSVEPDQNSDGDAEDQSEESDTGTDEDEYTLDDDGGEEGTEEDNPDGGEEDNSDGDSGEYSLDDDESSDGNEEEPTEGEESDTDSNLKQLEGELFDQLTPEQQTIKINELKKCFQELYERCDNLIQLLNDVSAPDENSSKVFEYLNDNLIDLKQYIYDYFTYTFETKLYIENSAQYQKYIALLNSLNGVLEELKKSKQE